MTTGIEYDENPWLWIPESYWTEEDEINLAIHKVEAAFDVNGWPIPNSPELTYG